MPTATINSTTWHADNSHGLKPWMTVRPCHLVRPGKRFFPVALTFFVAAVARTLHEGGSLALPLFLCSCALVLTLVFSTRQSWHSHIPGLRLLEIYFAVSAIILFILPSGHGMESNVVDLAAGLMPLALAPALPLLTTARKRVERVLVVGEGDMAGRLCRALDSEESVTSQPVTISGAEPIHGLVADLDGLDDVIERDGISRVVVAAQSAEMRRKVATALVDLRLCGLEVNDALDFYEATFGKVWLEALNSEWFVYTRGFYRSKSGIFLKRCVDIVFSLCLLIATAPILAIVAIAIRLDSRGPVLFRQTRVGLLGKPFTILKFRSMRVDAEAEAGPTWATRDDDRVTRVGRLIRRLHLDEVPQALNVLRGEMSLVGPRPERPVFVGRLSRMIPFYDMRHYVKPGITGWAQVKYRYGSTLEDAYQKLQYDIYYAKNRSLLCDLNVLVRTIGIVLFAKGL